MSDPASTARPVRPELMTLFVSSYAPVKRALMQAWSSQDIEAQRLAVHKLRGSLAWVSQPELLAQAAAFEKTLESQQAVSTDALLAWIKALDHLVRAHSPTA